MEPPAYRITTAENVDRPYMRLWHIVWTPREADDGLLESLYRDETYQEEIAPRLANDWTMDDIIELP